MIKLKNSSELELMREAGKITGEALLMAGEAVKPGVTLLSIDAKIRKFIESHGAKPSFLGYAGFPNSACISVNNEIIHGIPSSRELKDGDIVKIDVGAHYKGFHGDSANTFPVGNVSVEAQALIDATRESFYEAAKFMLPGQRLGDIGSAVQTYVEKRGYSVVREYIGHGVGRELHESPDVPNYGIPGRGLRLLEGMTIAVEPMVNAGSYAVRTLANEWTVVTADGKLSAHYEHTVAITSNGPVFLTKV